MPFTGLPSQLLLLLLVLQPSKKDQNNNSHDFLVSKDWICGAALLVLTVQREITASDSGDGEWMVAGRVSFCLASLIFKSFQWVLYLWVI